MSENIYNKIKHIPYIKNIPENPIDKLDNYPITFFMVQFDYKNNKTFQVLQDAFVESIKQKMPGAEIKIEHPKPPNWKSFTKNGKPVIKWMASNTLKLEIWVDYIKNAKNNTILVDCDMLLANPISEVFDHDFDVAMTIRTNSNRLPINGGAIYVKPNENSIKYFEELLELNNKMINDPKLHRKYKGVYQGINQSAMGMISENYDQNDSDFKLIMLPCKYYNCCQEDWNSVDFKKTRLIHCKSELRRCIVDYKINNKPFIRLTPNKKIKEIIQYWERYHEKSKKHNKNDILSTN